MKEKIDLIMEQVQEFASAWALFGTRFGEHLTMADTDILKSTVRTSIESLSANHIGNADKLVNAVNALAAQTGESAESITEWLTDKGGLTTLMLSHFGGMNKQSENIAKDAIQNGTGIGLVVDGKLQHIKQEDFYLSADDKGLQPAQEPVTNLFEIVTHGESGDAWLLLRADEQNGLGHHCIKFEGAAADDLRKRFKLVGSFKDQPAQEPAPVTITLTGHQLRCALALINPDGETDIDQLEDYLTFGIVTHYDDAGVIGRGMACWNDDTDGVLPLDDALFEPAKQEGKWISVEEAKATLKDGDLIYVAFENGKVEEAVYRFEQGFYPHRIISGYGNERIEHCTNVMRRNPIPMPLPPVKEVTE